MKRVAMVSYRAVDTWLEPHIGESFEVLSERKNEIEIDLCDGVDGTNPVFADKEYFDFLI